MLAEEIGSTISAEDIAEVLPLTQGDGSVYRKDEVTGEVSHDKVVTGAETARIRFSMTMPKLQSPDFKSFMEAAKNLKETGSTKPETKKYSDDDIERVKTGGIIGAMANKIVKKKHGQKYPKETFRKAVVFHSSSSLDPSHLCAQDDVSRSFARHDNLSSLVFRLSSN
jgi:hypothetical protein